MSHVRKALVGHKKPEPSTNARQWLDAFLTRGDQEAIGEALRSSFSGERGAFACPEGYDTFVERWEERLRSFTGSFQDGVTRIYRGNVKGRMVVGLGQASTRETNIHLDRTYGVPVIPGSALKGIAAAAADTLGGPWAQERVGKNAAPAGSDHAYLFGASAGEDGSSAGAVTFHDAWWTPANAGDRLPIHLDVMTVHQRGYYEGKAAPSDTVEPTPVSFLSTSGTYLIALTGPREWVDVAHQLLARGLSELGVGGKTRSGYGRISLDHKKSPLEEREGANASMIEKARDAGQLAQALEHLTSLHEMDVGAAAAFARLLVDDKAARDQLKKKREKLASDAGQLVITELDARAEQASAPAAGEQTFGANARKDGKKVVVTADDGNEYRGPLKKAIKKSPQLDAPLKKPGAVIRVRATVKDGEVTRIEPED